MTVNLRDLNLLVGEANALSSKPVLSKQEERRLTFLMSGIAAVKNGASLESVDQQILNADEDRAGLPRTTFEQKSLWEQRADSFRKQISEAKRDGVIGAADSTKAIGSYASLGYFVPNAFITSIDR